jgi:hypothetical protein
MYFYASSSFLSIKCFCTARTRTTPPLFPGTKGLSMREMSLLDSPSLDTTALEQPCPTHKLRCHKVIEVSLTSDFLLYFTPNNPFRDLCFPKSFFYLISPGGVRIRTIDLHDICDVLPVPFLCCLYFTIFAQRL